MSSLFHARRLGCAVGVALAGCLPASFDDLKTPHGDPDCLAGLDAGLDGGCGVAVDAGQGCDAWCGPDAAQDAGSHTPSCPVRECEPGTTDAPQPAPCGACNTGTTMRTRSCDEDGCWLPYVEGECTGVTAACAPGTTTDCENGDSCGQRVCTDACTWGACEPIRPDGCLRIGPTETEEGTHFRCCDYAPTPNGWQFCLPDCTWSLECVTCNPCPCPP